MKTYLCEAADKCVDSQIFTENPQIKSNNRRIQFHLAVSVEYSAYIVLTLTTNLKSIATHDRILWIGVGVRTSAILKILVVNMFRRMKDSNVRPMRSRNGSYALCLSTLYLSIKCGFYTHLSSPIAHNSRQRLINVHTRKFIG